MRRSFLPRFVLVISLSLPFFTGGAGAVEPGVDVAAPRVALSTVDGSTFAFHPANLVVEPGDWVRWSWLGGGHTTTSGPPCVASGLWNAPLNSFSPPTFTREFVESPGLVPYFCSIHCPTMVGGVTVTTLIDLSAKDAAGTSTLSWTGGGGRYLVYRGGAPTFIGAPAFTPDGGSAGTSFTDATSPSPGQAWFYLVMNLF